MAVGGIAIYHVARTELDELFDYQLRQLALSFRDQTFQRTYVAPTKSLDEEFDFVIEVWDSQGVRVFYSHPHRSLPGIAGDGYGEVSTHEGSWRVFATRTPGQVIQVAQPVSVRNTMALEAVSSMLLPHVLLLPLLSVLMWLVVGRGLSALQRLAATVATRTAHALDPLPERGIPEEVQPLVASLNGLLHRLRDAIAAQKSFIADAAHELRTPITALTLQVQVLERASRNPETKALVDELRAGVQRCTHAVNQLLTLARQDPDVSSRVVTAVPLAELARSVVLEQSIIAESKRIDLGLAASDEHALVQGDPDAMRTLLSNLVENALRYTPEGGRVDVCAATTPDGQPFLEVIDSGPGIPVGDRARIFDRFFRGEGNQEPGTGLGLAIVQRIAERHGASIQLGDAVGGGGFRIRVSFPNTAD
jgi:two-component system OmpR family sensor kinase